MVLRDKLQQLLAGSRRHRQEGQFLSLPRVESNTASEAENRIEHRAARSAETRAERSRMFCRVTAAQKPGAVGLVLNSVRPAHLSHVAQRVPVRVRRDQHMRGPDRRFIRSSQTPMGNQNASLRALRFDEHLREGRVRGIRRARRHRELNVTGEFQLARPQRSVGDLHAAQFDVIFRGDGDVQNSFDPGGAPMNFRAVRSKPHRDFAGARLERLMRRRPDINRYQIAYVD